MENCKTCRLDLYSNVPLRKAIFPRAHFLDLLMCLHSVGPKGRNAWHIFDVMSWNKMADALEEIVPREPSSAIFSRADFMKESFSVDSFVGSCKGSVPLDALKANLDDYLKSLKHALIELINEDYADFVNLSTNLVSTWFA